MICGLNCGRGLKESSGFLLTSEWLHCRLLATITDLFSRDEPTQTYAVTLQAAHASRSTKIVER